MKPPPIRTKTLIKPVNPARARTRPLASLSRKVERGQFASELHARATMREFIAALPETQAAADLRELARRIAAARRAGRNFLMPAGAHPLKVGLSPLICGMLRDGVLSAIATNGAAIIHDFELAFAGRTSEDVGAGLNDGSFGMAEETGAFLNRAARLAAEENRGLGEVVGRGAGVSPRRWGAGKRGGGRPPAGGKGARGIALTGHHEIMFPLLAAAVREELARPARRRG